MEVTPDLSRDTGRPVMQPTVGSFSERTSVLRAAAGCVVVASVKNRISFRGSVDRAAGHANRAQPGELLQKEKAELALVRNVHIGTA